LQQPVAPRARVVRRFHLRQQGQRLGGAVLLQQVGDKIEPRAGIGRIAREAFVQQALGRFDLAGYAQEAAKIGGGRGVAGFGAQGLAHRRLGVLDGAPAIAGDAVIHPGVGPLRRQSQRGGEGLLGARRLVHRHPGLPVGVMRLRQMRRRMACLARGAQRGLPVACLAMGLEGEKKCGRIVTARPRFARCGHQRARWLTATALPAATWRRS
jgi:hypothetical protein